MAAEDTGRKFRITLSWTDNGAVKTFNEVLDDPERKCTLGRKGDFVIKGNNVDEKHCLIRLDSKGNYYVMDNGSEHGTLFSADGQNFVSIGSAAMSRNDRKRAGKTLVENSVIRIGDQDVICSQLVELTILMPSRQLLLQVVSSDGTDEPPFLMKFRSLTIGRKSAENPKSSNEFMIVKDNEKKVSREHCKILLERRHRIEDVSTLGTFVKRGPVARDAIAAPEGWAQVGKRERADLSPGDVIRLADAVYIRVIDPSENGRVPMPPAELRLTDRSTNSLRLEWSPPPADGNPLPVKTYRLQRLDGAEWVTLMAGEGTEFVVMDLEPAHEYTLCVQAQNDIGFSERSEKLVVRTAAAAADTDETASQLTVVPN